MAQGTLSLINVWTDPEPGAGGFNPMAASMLWMPAGCQPGNRLPAFVYVHGWGGYPYDPVPSAVGPLLAERGGVFLSLCLRRRGMEGQLMALPDNDRRDIKLAVDYLHTNGFGPIMLIGDELGCISALDYLGACKDRRIAGAYLLNPVAAPADYLQQAIGAETYAEQLQFAGIAARQGAGMDTRIDLMPPDGPIITQQAMAFLAWWSPGVRELAPVLGQLKLPLRVAAQAAVPPELAAVARIEELDAAAEPDRLAAELIEWAQTLGGSSAAQPAVEMVHTESAGRSLFGLLWAPGQKQPPKTIVLLVHGLTSSPLSPLFLQMGPLLAGQNMAAVAVELRRSGWAGHESALFEFDTEDLDAWVGWLLEQGYEKIVLAGASIGSISIGRYQSVRQHPNVVALAHLMPTADCPVWFEQGVGAGPYAAAVSQAEAAIAAGQGDSALIDIDLRQPPPNKYSGRFRWTQRAASWLSWFGPAADSMNSVHIANAKVPVLLLSGTEDSYNDVDRFAELVAAAANAPSIDEIWYPDIDHGLAGVEAQVAADLGAWVNKIGAV